jgi:hypothetical protein
MAEKPIFFTAWHNSSIDRKLYVQAQTEWLMFPFNPWVFVVVFSQLANVTAGVAATAVPVSNKFLISFRLCMEIYI